MKKKILSILFILASFALVQNNAFAQVVPQGLEYQINGDTVIITRYTGDAAVLEIPVQIQNLPVTQIADRAFFECRNLENITIPDSVTDIGEWAFLNCYSLTGVTFKGSEINFMGNAFAGDLEEKFESCGAGTYTKDRDSDYWKNNEAISKEMPEGFEYSLDRRYGYVTITGYRGTDTTVEIPSQIEGLPVVYIGDRAFEKRKAVNTVIIPDSVVDIGWLAFVDCINLKNIIIPESVTTISSMAFYGCSNLVDITFPKSVTKIGSSVFYDCKSLTSINIDPGNPEYSSRDGILYDKEQRTIIIYPKGRKGAFVIPDFVTSIWHSAFSGSSLSDITIPDSVTFIGSGAFSDTELADITIPDSVTDFGSYVFSQCRNLAGVKLSDNISVINEGVFDGCVELTDIIIPESVTSIERLAFLNCFKLKNIIIPAGVTNIGEGAFSGCFELTKVTFKGSDTKFYDNDSFPGDLVTKYANGAGTYTRKSGESEVWSKKSIIPLWIWIAVAGGIALIAGVIVLFVIKRK